MNIRWTYQSTLEGLQGLEGPRIGENGRILCLHNEKQTRLLSEFKVLKVTREGNIHILSC